MFPLLSRRFRMWLQIGLTVTLVTLVTPFQDAGKKPDPPAKAAGATEPPPKPTLPQGTPAQQVAMLRKQYEEAQAEFRKRYEAAKSDAEVEKLFLLLPRAEDYTPLFLQIAEQHPRDPATVDALLWVVRNTRNTPGKTDTPYAKARAVLIRDHLGNPKIGTFCLTLRYEEFDPAAVSLLRQVAEKHADKPARAQATYALAKLLQRRADFGTFLRKQTNEKQTAAFTKTYGPEAIADLKSSDPDRQRREAETLLERLTQDKEFAATVIPRGEDKIALGELAERELFEIRHLVPGKPAPEITGEDLDGKPMKLSDFRGRVVLLDFWGHW
jgi:hypothetical protein